MRATEAFLQRNLFHLAAHPTGISRRSFSVKINNFFAKIQFTIFAFPCFIHGIRTFLKSRIPCLTRIPRFFFNDYDQTWPPMPLIKLGAQLGNVPSFFEPPFGFRVYSRNTRGEIHAWSPILNVKKVVHA